MKTNTSFLDHQEDIGALVQKLADAEAALQAVARGQIDTVIDANGQTILLRETQEALRRANQRLHHLITHSPAVIYSLQIVNDSVIPRFVSNNITHLLGVTPDEALTQGWWLANVHPADRGIALTSIKEARTKGKSRVEYRLRHRDGSYRWIEDYRRLAAGGPDGAEEIAGVWTDVSERHAAQDRLRASESSLAAAQRLAHLGNWEIDLVHPRALDQCPTRWSEELFRILGFQPGEVSPSSERLLSVVHREDRGRVRRSREELADSGASYDMTYRIILGDGSERTVHEHADFIPTSGCPCILGTVQDITSRVKSEEERMRSEERFRQMFRASPIAMACKNEDGTITDVNNRWSEIFEYPRNDAIGRTCEQLAIWACPDEHERAADLLATIGSVRDFECQFRRKSGKIGVGLLSMEKLRFCDQTLVLSMVVDVTEKKHLEEQAYRAQRIDSVGRLAGGIAHDMNNILAPIMMAAPMLRDSISGSDETKLLTTIETSAQRGAQLVKQLLLFGRGVEGKRSRVRLAELVMEMESLITETFPKTITVNTHLPSLPLAVFADATQIHQVLLNLCVNARDAMPDGGRLSIEIQAVGIEEPDLGLHPDARLGHYVRIAVADTGIGIPAEHMDHIFDPFYTTKDSGKGTGLGLSTVVGIVKSHSGFITVRSELGVGSAFSVYLPAVPDAAIDAPVSAPMPIGRGNNQTVLLVDDEENIRELARAILVRHGYRVIIARDGAEAASLFQYHRDQIRLVITDFDMPVMDGISLVKILRCADPSLGVLVCSGIQSGLKAKGEELAVLGIKTILSKPYSHDDLVAAVEQNVTQK